MNTDRLLAAAFILAIGLVDAAATYVLVAAGLAPFGIGGAIIAIYGLLKAGPILNEETRR